jgi:hypothetical protein
VKPERITDEKWQSQDALCLGSRARWEVFAGNDPPPDPAVPARQNILRFA